MMVNVSSGATTDQQCTGQAHQVLALHGVLSICQTAGAAQSDSRMVQNTVTVRMSTRSLTLA